MKDPAAPERVFSERYVGALFKRATELQEEGASAGQGITMAEVEHIAADLGIAPEHLRTAAAELVWRMTDDTP